MGCDDTRDSRAASSPIRTQLSVSRCWRIPAIIAPARLETENRLLFKRALFFVTCDKIDFLRSTMQTGIVIEIGLEKSDTEADDKLK